MAKMKKIAANLWFDHEAEEAARFYTSIFKNSKLGRTAYYGHAGQEIHKQKPGTVMTVEFTLEDQEYLALNGGSFFKFNEAISFIVNCETQEEIDYYWERLSAGGDPKAQQCGWLKDRFGLSWQIVPESMADMAAEPDEEKRDRVMSAMLKMKKMDKAELEKAYAGE